MDATTRWETEAMRASSAQRKNPPRPSAKRSGEGGSNTPDVDLTRRWVTLKEAEAATDIPSNTIRKWVRKDTVDSYLESDGEMALRMVDLDSLLARANALGRTVVEAETTDHRPQTTDPQAETTADHRPQTTEPTPEPERAEPEGTMLVPIDAWNKMLNQLGNLHEAGQQLAEARERAAKAETESVFLRERLAEMRQKTTDQKTTEQKTTDHRPQTTDAETEPAADTALGEGPSIPPSVASDARLARAQEPNPDAEPDGNVETTTYWRYLTTGWRDRKRRSRE